MATTIEEFINSKPNIEISYEFLSLYEIVKNKGIISYNLLNDYYDDLKNASIPITLSDDLYAKWKYNPERLCREIYGIPDLSFIVLAINGMASPKEFTKKKVNLIKVSDFELIITDIINAEKDTKMNNEQKIK